MTNLRSPFAELQKLYKALLYSQLVFGALAVLVVQFRIINPFATEAQDRLIQVVVVIFSFAAVIIGMQLFRRKIEACRESGQGVREKLGMYKNACLVQWALLESAFIFSMASYIITGNWAFIGLAIMLLAIFGGLNPFRQKVMLQL